MKELLLAGEAILEILEGPLESLEELPQLLSERGRLTESLSKPPTPEQKAAALHQDELLLQRCAQVLSRLSMDLRWKPKHSGVSKPKFIDQRS